MKLPAGFERAPDLLALGGELKAAFCFTRDGEALLSRHHGDLEDAAAFDGFRASLGDHTRRLSHKPRALVADRHPAYFSGKLARASARERGVPLIEVQHHHAHIAACLIDNHVPLEAAPVLGIVLDGLGWGDDDAIWGGEFLLADYRRAERIGTFKPVAMLGGDCASREPWRNLYAHLMAELGWAELKLSYAELECVRYLEAKPRALLDRMLRERINSPLASSCGRLFDAVAAALDLCRERQAYEGEAPQRLEALAGTCGEADAGDSPAYPFGIPRLQGSGLPYVEPLPMWRALLGDLAACVPASVVAARFHRGLARAIAAMALRLRGERRFEAVALSGGCFQNRILFAEVERLLRGEGLGVLGHARLPAHDGALAVGQAAVGAARLLAAG